MRLIFDCLRMSGFLADNLVLRVPPNRCVGCPGVVATDNSQLTLISVLELVCSSRRGGCTV